MPAKKTTRTISSARLLTGRERTLGGGKRPCRAALYAPSARYASYRVTFKEEDDAGVWVWTTRNAGTEDDARKLFEQVEAALDAHRPAPARSRVQAERDMRALGQLYISGSKAGLSSAPFRKLLSLD